MKAEKKTPIIVAHDKRIGFILEKKIKNCDIDIRKFNLTKEKTREIATTYRIHVPSMQWSSSSTFIWLNFDVGLGHHILFVFAIFIILVIFAISSRIFIFVCIGISFRFFLASTFGSCGFTSIGSIWII